MSVREMYRRLASGLPVATNPNLRFTGDEFIPNLEMLDPVERDEYIEKITRENEEDKQKIKARNDELQAEKDNKEQELFKSLLEKYGPQATVKTPQGEGSGEPA